LHDLILAVWPGLAPVVALDGADPHGVPPAAVRAVLHWVQAARRDPAAQMRCQIAVAALWRVPPTVAASLIADVEAAALHAPEAVVPLVAAIGLKGLAMRPRWQAQAEAARRALDDVWAVEREASPAAVRSVSEEAR
jgi:hypothetical protein